MRHRHAKGPAVQGLPMRRRGLEPPPGYPGPGPQPGNSRVISVHCVQIVQIVQPRGRYGRNGRSGCCHGCCHEPHCAVPAAGSAGDRGAEQSDGPRDRLRAPGGASLGWVTGRLRPAAGGRRVPVRASVPAALRGRFAPPRIRLRRSLWLSRRRPRSARAPPSRFGDWLPGTLTALLLFLPLWWHITRLALGEDLLTRGGAVAGVAVGGAVHAFADAQQVFGVSP
jgi:hypothetical protein